MSPRLRIWLAALVLALPPLAIALAWAVGQPLPGTIATHWSGIGVADGFSETAPMAGWLLAATGAMLALALVLAAARMDGRLRAMLLSCLAVVSGMLAGAFIASIGATGEAGSAEEAVLGLWVIVLLAPALLFLAPWWIHPADDASGAPGRGALALPATDAIEWRGSAGSPLFGWLAAALATIGIALVAVLPQPSLELRLFLGLVLLASAAFVLALARIRVTVDADALRVRSATLGVPLRTVATERMRAVEAAIIEPVEWGGWGYRGLPGQAAIVLRRAPGIVVTSRDGSRFAVTVDDAEAGAAVLAGIVERSRQPRG